MIATANGPHKKDESLPKNLTELSNNSSESIYDEFKIKYYKTTHELLDKPENLNFYESVLHT
jgi:hypothetical protein